MNENQAAHPAALKPGKCLVEATYTGMKSDIDRDARVEYKASGGRCYGIWVDPATVHPASVLEDLRAKMEAAEKEYLQLESHHHKQFYELQEVLGKDDAIVECAKRMRNERDAARRDLAEALKLLKTTTFVAENEDEAWALELRKKAILARHEREERRKGERDRRKEYDHDMACEYARREGQGDRRKQPATVDWQARCEAAETECERLRSEGECIHCGEIGDMSVDHWRTCKEHPARAELSAANARAEEAEAKLAEEKVKVNKLVNVFNNLPTCNGDEVRHKVLLLVREAIRGEYTPPERKPWPETDYPKDVWYEAVQDRIEACERAIDAMKGGE